MIDDVEADLEGDWLVPECLDLAKGIVNGIIIANSNDLVVFVTDLALEFLDGHLPREYEDFLLFLAQEGVVQLLDILIAVGLSESIVVQLLTHVLS